MSLIFSGAKRLQFSTSLMVIPCWPGPGLWLDMMAHVRPSPQQVELPALICEWTRTHTDKAGIVYFIRCPQHKSCSVYSSRSKWPSVDILFSEYAYIYMRISELYFFFFCFRLVTPADSHAIWGDSDFRIWRCCSCCHSCCSCCSCWKAYKNYWRQWVGNLRLAGN